MFFICSGINGCFGVIYLYLGEKDMKRLMFLGVFLLFCCGVVSSANAAVCCTISYDSVNKKEYTATNSCTALGGLSNDFPPECSKGVCDVADGGNITCAAGLTKCCVYDAACGNTNYLKCSCVVDCQPCNGVQSEKQYDKDGCTNYQSVRCEVHRSAVQPSSGQYEWVKAVVTTETTACSKGCYLENRVCNKCPDGNTTDSDRNSSGLDSCKLDCSGDGKMLDETRNMCICKAGYYNEDGNCQKCPNFDVATSLAGKADSVEDCYLPVTKKYEDEKGWFETTSKCNYDASQN